MRLVIDNPDLLRLGKLLAGHGHMVRLVGGAVRDALLGLEPKDLDLASDATPQETVAVAERHGLRVIPTGLQHGTVTVVMGDTPFEITTLRRDVETDGRHAVVEYVRDFRVDAGRRDFTINALSADLSTGQVHDYFDGVDDLRNGRVRFVGDPAERIEEDYLRILRFFRFRTRFKTTEAEDLDQLGAVADGAHGLFRISGERIWAEMEKILAHRSGERELRVMANLSVDVAIGLPVTEGGARAVGLLQGAGASAAVTLGVLAGDRLEALAERWRPSTAEFKAARAAAVAWTDRSDDPHMWRCRLADGADPDVLVPVLRARGHEAAARGVAAGVPDFPVRGADVVETGIAPGKQVGRTLAGLRQAWKDSSFELDREELLASLASNAPPRP
jgi:tRNA nucleotidyltransferase/poly(A) polymerase